MAINAGEVESMIATARQQQLFLMEAMWTRFLPAIVQVRQWLQQGRIGEVRMLTADFGFRAEFNPAGRLFNPQLGGGALLDVGIYTVALATMVFGLQPETVVTTAALGRSGVDEQNAALLRYADGAMAVLSSAVRTNTPHTARIDGTAGRITIPNFWRCTSATLEPAGAAAETIEAPFEINVFEYEIREAMRCLRHGLGESPSMPLAESLAIAMTMDRMRSQWPLRYPMEEQQG